MILKLKKINLQTNNGTSLIEFVVSMSIFTTVLMATTGAYFSYSTGSRKSFASQNVIDEGRFILDTMSKEMRTGKDFLQCTINTGGAETVDYTCINFTDAENNIIKYMLKNKSIQKTTSTPAISPGTPGTTTENSITSDQIKVDRLNFIIVGNIPNDTLQPKVTISLKLSNLNDSGKSELNSSIELQTTISQRQKDN